MFFNVFFYLQINVFNIYVAEGTRGHVPPEIHMLNILEVLLNTLQLLLACFKPPDSTGALPQ